MELLLINGISSIRQVPGKPYVGYGNIRRRKVGVYRDVRWKSTTEIKRDIFTNG